MQKLIVTPESVELDGRAISDLDVRCYNCNILYEYEQGRRNLPLNWKELYGT